MVDYWGVNAMAHPSRKELTTRSTRPSLLEREITNEFLLEAEKAIGANAECRAPISDTLLAGGLLLSDSAANVECLDVDPLFIRRLRER